MLICLEAEILNLFCHVINIIEHRTFSREIGIIVFFILKNVLTK